MFPDGARYGEKKSTFYKLIILSTTATGDRVLAAASLPALLHTQRL